MGAYGHVRLTLDGQLSKKLMSVSLENELALYNNNNFTDVIVTSSAVDCTKSGEPTTRSGNDGSMLYDLLLILCTKTFLLSY